MRQLKTEPSETSNWPDKYINHWTKDGIKLNHPATLDNIIETEKIINFSFPEQFKKLYLRVDGFREWDCTRDMFSIWPLERIVTEYNEESDKNFVGFADYMIKAHMIGFVRSQKGIFKGPNGGRRREPEFIASTFLDAILLIDTDADILY